MNRPAAVTAIQEGNPEPMACWVASAIYSQFFDLLKDESKAEKAAWDMLSNANVNIEVSNG